MKIVSRFFLSITLLFLLFAVRTSAQYAGTTFQQRIGHGRDSVRNYTDLMTWTRFTNENSKTAFENFHDMSVSRSWNAESYRVWYNLTHGTARHSLFSLYMSGGGADMLRYLMHHEADAAVKLTYFDDLMWLSDFRIQHLDALNSLPDYGPLSANTLADAMAWKAHYYYTEGKYVSPRVYDKLAAYHYFVDAMKAVREQKSVSGTEVAAYLIEEYFNACYELYLSDKDKYMVQFLTDYLDCAQTCKRLYETAKDKEDKDEAEQQFNAYYGEYVRVIQPIFQASGAGNPDSLDNYFRSRFKEKSGDIDYVNTAVALMVQNGCLPSLEKNRCVEQYAEAAYAYPEQMNYFSALAYGMKLNKDAVLLTDSVAKQQKRVEMRTAFDKALSYARTNAEKAEVCLQIGKALNQPLDPMLASNVEEVDRWKNDMDGVIRYFEEAGRLDADHYAVIANYYLELAYRSILAAYNNEGYVEAHNPEQRFAIRKDQLDFANASIACANTAIKESDRALANHVYEQDGINIRTLARNAQVNAPQKAAQQIQKTVNSYQARYVRKGNGGNKTNTGIDEDWHKNTWHPYLKKKGADQAFWSGHGVVCKYCGKEFK